MCAYILHANRGKMLLQLKNFLLFVCDQKLDIHSKMVSGISLCVQSNDQIH